MPEYPDSLRDVGLDYVLQGGLKREEGFYQLQGPPVAYLLDPGLDEATSHCYDPEYGSKSSPGSTNQSRNGDLLVDLLGDSDPEQVPTPKTLWSLKESDALEALLKVDEEQSRPGLAIANQVRDVFDDFFKLICHQRDDIKSLKAFLDTTTVTLDGEIRPLFAVGVRFWIEGPDKADLNCQVELRLFKLKLDPPFPNAPYADLTRCELIYRDAATGSVPIDKLDNSRVSAKKAVRAAVIQALRNGIAVNFCLNPQIDYRNPVQRLGSKVCGDHSISEYQKRGERK